MLMCARLGEARLKSRANKAASAGFAPGTPISGLSRERTPAPRLSPFIPSPVGDAVSKGWKPGKEVVRVLRNAPPGGAPQEMPVPETSTSLPPAKYSQLVDLVASQTGNTPARVQEITDAFLGELLGALRDGRKVRLGDFGNMRARIGENGNLSIKHGM